MLRTEGLCLAQVAGANKGNELDVLPELLGLLDLSGGALVNVDALGCKRESRSKSPRKAATTY